MEVLPDPENRVTLDRDLEDPLGLPRPRYPLPAGSFDHARPVYPYPATVRYRGRGDPKDAGSWRKVEPAAPRAAEPPSRARRAARTES